MAFNKPESNSPPHVEAELGVDTRHRSLWGDAVLNLGRNRMAMVGLSLAVLLVFCAIAAPWVSPYDPVAMDTDHALEPPSWQHLMGTDSYGRDILSRIVYGSRVSLAVGLISVGISLLVGTILGLITGYFMGPIDVIVSRFLDILYSFPPILLALLMISLFGVGIEKAMIAIGLVYTPIFARVCRASVISERSRVYIEAARIVGASNGRIIWRHIMPNVLAPLIVQASMSMAWAILAEAALSFLGLGTQPPTPSWGMMLSKGRAIMHMSPWVSIWPGLAIMLVVYAFNLLGDGLRDALDPRLRK